MDPQNRRPASPVTRTLAHDQLYGAFAASVAAARNRATAFPCAVQGAHLHFGPLTACLHLALPVVVWHRRGVAALAGLGEQGEEPADPVSFLGGVAEQAVVVDGVPGTPAGPGAGQVTGGFQVGHDGLDGALVSPTTALMSRIRARGLRAISTSTCPCPVRSVQLPPLSSGSLMSPDRILPEERNTSFFSCFY